MIALIPTIRDIFKVNDVKRIGIYGLVSLILPVWIGIRMWGGWGDPTLWFGGTWLFGPYSSFYVNMKNNLFYTRFGIAPNIEQLVWIAFSLILIGNILLIIKQLSKIGLSKIGSSLILIGVVVLLVRLAFSLLFFFEAIGIFLILIGNILLIKKQSSKIGSSLIIIGCLSLTLNLFIMLVNFEGYILIPIGIFYILSVGIRGLTIMPILTPPTIPKIPEIKTPKIIREKEYTEIEETISKPSILSIESSKLFVNEWGKIIVKVKGEGKASINLEGDVDWIKPELKDLSGESIIEIPVKPKISGEVPVKVIIDSSYKKESSTTFLKVEKKEEKPPQFVTPITVQEKTPIKVPELDDIIPLRNIPLKNLFSGYACGDSKVFKVNFVSGFIPKEFEGAWECCLLGCGGWGCAYLCIRGENKIVIKIPRGFESVIEGGIEAPTGHEALLKKIKSEAEIMGSLNHPNIIKLLGVSNRVPLIIYEFADYGSLYWQLNKGWRPSIKDVILIGIQLGDALRYIHSRGLIHGDIKPSNVFIKDKIAKLGDFSSTVKLLSSVSISKMVYTVGFRAPEQVFSDIRRKSMGMGIENRIDIYQIGNLLLYILTGESIDGEEAINDKLVMDKLNGISNEDLKQILAKALALEPAKRPSAEDLTKMLYTVWNKV
jgi:hypothetical protein